MNLISPLRNLKKMPLVMAFVVVYSTLTPTVGYALGTGPGQPELEGFSPIGMNSMVDPFTGDFSYNLPLLNVPGPGGGYPLNLTYSAGITMDQEASWVGLGWNLNAGSISRELRGLPDDFNGQGVVKKLNQKPNQTFGAGISGIDIEALGANLTKTKALDVDGNIMLTYNNYKGFDVQAGLGFSIVESNATSGIGQAETGDPVNKDTGEKEGGGESYPEKVKDNDAKEEKWFTFDNARNKYLPSFKNMSASGIATKAAGKLRTITSPFVHDIGYINPMSVSSYSLNVKTGLDAVGLTGDVQIMVHYNEQKIDPEYRDRSVPAYGYLHSENNLDQSESGLMDFTLTNQSQINPNSKYLPIPNHTYDIFHVKAQGVTGAVRAYKGGVTELVDPTVISKRKNIGGGGELNVTPPSTKGGVNINGGYGRSYSGPWKAGKKDLDFVGETFEKEIQNNGVFEPYYFKFANELTSEENSSSVHTDQSSSRLKMGVMAGLHGAEPKVTSELRGAAHGSLTKSNVLKEDREKRAKVFQILTEKESKNYEGLYDRKVTPLPSGSPISANNYSVSDRIGSVRVTDEGGKRYVFGIAAKNKKFSQSTFSIGAQYGSNLSNLIGTTVPFSPVDNSTGNKKGTDNYYNATITPEYAHSFLLTEILSEDYRDLGTSVPGGVDGPSPDDFGDYVKFDYYVKQDFKTRTPISGASYLPGSLSNNGDDKGSVTYFEKDLYYLKEVKTKTHIAVFELNAAPREDAYGVANENSAPLTSMAQYSLNKITLYNLDDYENSLSPKPIKTIKFNYKPVGERLCYGAPNAPLGKLTLESVEFQVGDEKTKMSLSPYKFTYAENMDYNSGNIDRWSTYQAASTNEFGSNVLYPYTAQDERALSDQHASTWNLQTITLPTGGVITVDYESDDYKYVQNQKAQAMYKILGFMNSASGSTYSGDMSEGNIFMVVQLPEPISGPLSDYTEGISDAYFKAFVKMKKFGSSSLKPTGTPFVQDETIDKAVDFVSGYVNFIGNPTQFSGSTDKIVIQIKPLGGHHPIKKQGWLDLQTTRNDLLDESGINLGSFSNLLGSLNAVGQVLGQMLDWLVDESSFFAKAEASGWCQEIITGGVINGDAIPSILRLNKIGSKVGGGHRVRSIEIYDNWAEMNGGQSSTFGQDYAYTLEDGTSSGVASYEPLTGGEENPLKKPFRYSNNDFIFKNKNLFTEMPLGEEFYPSPIVGYSRVTIENRANRYVSLSGDARVVKEFYTAKDYPVEVKASVLTKVNTDFTTRLTDFIGAKNFFQPGFSQGYTVKTNDMHGKLKSEATYYADRSEGKAPYEKTTYRYKTKGGYGGEKFNRLDNEAYVFHADGAGRVEQIGVDQDSYYLLRETSQEMISGDIDANLEWTLPFFIVPTAFPTVDYTYQMTRMAVMNKVITQAGILEEVVTERNGAQTSTENVAFDHDTGEPVVNTITNEHGSKIYHYNQYAKWYYKEMQGAYQNIGLRLSGAISLYQDVLVPGDVLMNASGNKAWVEVKPDGDLIAYNSSGNEVTSLTGYKVIESGYGNNLTAKSGFIQSVNDPTQDPSAVAAPLALFEAYNINKPGNTSDFIVSYLRDCETNTSEIQNVTYGLFEELSKDKYDNLTYGDGCTEVISVHTGPLPDDMVRWDAGRQLYLFWHYTLIDVESQTYEERYTECTDAYYDHAVSFLGGTNYVNCINDDGFDIRFTDIPISTDIFDYSLYLEGDKVKGVHANGTIIHGTIWGHDNKLRLTTLPSCFVGCIGGVLNSEAYRFTDEAKDDRYVSPVLTAQNSWVNSPYRFGYRGVFKQNKTLIYPENRTQNGTSNTSTSGPNYPTRSFEDGQYLKYFVNTPDHTDPGKWIITSEVTKFDQNGIAIEERNAIGNYSSMLYGYERTLPTMLASNASVEEIAYDSFEDYPSNGYLTSRRDNQLNLGTGVELLKGDAHTGDYSIKINQESFPPQSLNTMMSLTSGKKYVLQAWHKVASPGELTVNNGSGAVAAEVKSANIDGWELVEVAFVAGTSNTIGFTAMNGQFDDIKIQPFNAASKTYVYDSYTHKLVAQLDENHFATIYNYDRDQVLVQVKKETNRGIKTIQSSQRVTQAN